jgi:hypothetical protein
VLGGSAENNPKAAVVYETPSDQGHAGTDLVGLDWADFQNTPWLMTPVKDQGQRGTCHAEAVTGPMEALLKLRRVNSGQPVAVAGRTYHINEDVALSVSMLGSPNAWGWGHVLHGASRNAGPCPQRPRARIISATLSRSSKLSDHVVYMNPSIPVAPCACAAST